MSQTTFQPAQTMILSTLESLKVYFDPLRQRIVNEISAQPRSVHQIANALNIPFTRLYYHLNLLEKYQLITLVESRSGVGAIEEKFYQVSANMFIIDRALLSPRSDDVIAPAMETIINTVFHQSEAIMRQNILNRTIDLDVTAPHHRALMIRRGSLRLSQEQAEAFQQELIDLIIKYQRVSIPEDNPSQSYNITLTLFPVDLATDNNTTDSDDESLTSE